MPENGREKKEFSRAIFPRSSAKGRIILIIISRYVRLEVSRTEEGEETQEFPAQLPFFLSYFQSKNYSNNVSPSQGVSVATLGAPQWLYVPPDLNDHWLFAVPRKTQIENPSENVSKIIPPQVTGSHPVRGRSVELFMCHPWPDSNEKRVAKKRRR